MPIHKIDKNQNKLQLIRPNSFTTEQFRERRDLQPLLRNNPEVIDSELFLITEEFDSWEGSTRRIDLLGLDSDGNLVVIELKRIEDGGHMELQAIRYAAMVSAMNFEAVVRAHEAFLLKQGREVSGARQSLKDFLGVNDSEEVIISNTPRIVLVAPSFSREIATTVLWLNEQSLDIRCVEANLYNLDGNLYLDIEQVIPLPSAANYQITIRDKVAKAERKTSTKRGERNLNVLLTYGVLAEGTRVHLIQPPRPDLEIPDERAKWAVFIGGGTKNFQWEYDGNIYSLSGLCKVICEKYGGYVGTGAFQGPNFWAIEGETVSLTERAQKLGSVDTSESLAVE